MPKSPFNRPTVLVGALLILGGCASSSDPKPAICDGKHRRPANPYGSVLPTTPTDAATPASAPSSPASPVPPAAIPPRLGPRASLDPRSFAPCGDGA